MTIYSPNNLPKDYYVYAYLREDGTPYYIGKGKGRRAYMKRAYKPNDTSRIVIMEQGLTEIGAFALERMYIRWYGRKDLETGILRNLTDGGEGWSGVVRTEEYRRNLSIALTGRKHSPEHVAKNREAKLGKKQSSETRAKRSAKLKGRVQSAEWRAKNAAAHLGVKHSPERNAKKSAARKGLKQTEAQKLAKSIQMKEYWARRKAAKGS
jgi:hypothetical protein